MTNRLQETIERSTDKVTPPEVQAAVHVLCADYGYVSEPVQEWARAIVTQHAKLWIPTIVGGDMDMKRGEPSHTVTDVKFYERSFIRGSSVSVYDYETDSVVIIDTDVVWYDNGDVYRHGMTSRCAA